MLLSALIRVFLAWCDTHRAKRTSAEYRRYLERFLAAVGDQAVEELRPHHLMSWGKTWHELQAVQRCFSWGTVSAELIGKNPFSSISRPPLGVRRRTLSRLQLAQLLRHSAADFRRYLLGARETIARPQEVRAACWEHLRHDGTRGELAGELVAGRAWIELTEFKARERRADPQAVRVIPITPRLGRLLARLAAAIPAAAGPIFLTRAGRAWTKEAVRLRMRRLRRRLGWGPDHRGEQICVYTLRHTGGTDAAAAGVRDRVLAELMGHTSTRTTARYQHLDTGHLIDAMGKLVTYRKKKRPGSH